MFTATLCIYNGSIYIQKCEGDQKIKYLLNVIKEVNIVRQTKSNGRFK